MGDGDRYIVRWQVQNSNHVAVFDRISNQVVSNQIFITQSNRCECLNRETWPVYAHADTAAVDGVDRAFAVAAPRAWNSLTEFVTDCSQLQEISQDLLYVQCDA